MAVEEVQQLIDLMVLTPEVTELSVQSVAGTRVSIKRAPVAPVAAQVVLAPSVIEESEDEQTESPSAVMPALTINATLVGLFHATNPPITAGSTIVSGQIVGYIESMRLMNEVVSSVEGTVEAAAASEGQPVEYGQPLFALTVR